MNRMTALIALPALIFFGACDQLGGFEDILGTGDTSTSTPGTTIDPLIAGIDFGCDTGNPDQWWYDVVNEGWSGGVTLDIFETGAWTGSGSSAGNANDVWDESHELTNIEFAEDGSSDRWGISLNDVETPGQQVSGSTTLFGCAWNDGGSLAFMVTMRDENNNQADCAIFGFESEQYFNGLQNNSCICFENDSNCSN
ncbi:MAG: hypothetical protein ACJAZO_002393 [Myxococcota bacterium]|jgi:hypothetical protein